MKQEYNVVLVGRLGREPSLRYTGSGKPVTDFSLAVTHRAKDKDGDGWHDVETYWFNCVYFGMVEDIRKGDLAKVSGYSVTDEWTGRDGEQRKTLKVIADSVILAERKGTRTAQPDYGGEEYEDLGSLTPGD